MELPVAFIMSFKVMVIVNRLHQPGFELLTSTMHFMFQQFPFVSNLKSLPNLCRLFGELAEPICSKNILVVILIEIRLITKFISVRMTSVISKQFLDILLK
jgi:hypothetical protein